MSDWPLLNTRRVGLDGLNDITVPEKFWTRSDAGFNGLFRFNVDGHWVQCIASDGRGWQHVSVTIKDSKKPPKWDLMCHVKDLFWEEDDLVVQFHPRRKNYVNNHPGCLHLWRWTDGAFPEPPSWMVGVRDKQKLADSLKEASMWTEEDRFRTWFAASPWASAGDQAADMARAAWSAGRGISQKVLTEVPTEVKSPS